MKKWFVFILLVLPAAFYAADTNGRSRVEKAVFESASLGTFMPYQIYLPPNYQTNQRYPVLYLIHGYSGNESFFFSYLGINRIADKLIRSGQIAPMIIVTPYVKDSFCLNSAGETGIYIINSNTLSGMAQGRYEDYVVNDLIQHIDSNYQTLTDREHRFIGGISMGGFGALYLAFRHPELFSRAGGHSSALVTNQALDEFWKWIYPDENRRNERDPLRLATTRDIQGLKIYLDCGTGDSLFTGSFVLASVLRLNKANFEFHENAGEHLLSYWIYHAEEYLKFYGRPVTK